MAFTCSHTKTEGSSTSKQTDRHRTYGPAAPAARHHLHTASCCCGAVRHAAVRVSPCAFLNQAGASAEVLILLGLSTGCRQKIEQHASTSVGLVRSRSWAASAVAAAHTGPSLRWSGGIHHCARKGPHVFSSAAHDSPMNRHTHRPQLGAPAASPSAAKPVLEAVGNCYGVLQLHHSPPYAHNCSCCYCCHPC